MRRTMRMRGERTRVDRSEKLENYGSNLKKLSLVAATATAFFFKLPNGHRDVS